MSRPNWRASAWNGGLVAAGSGVLFAELVVTGAAAGVRSRATVGVALALRGGRAAASGAVGATAGAG